VSSIDPCIDHYGGGQSYR